MVKIYFRNLVCFGLLILICTGIGIFFMGFEEYLKPIYIADLIVSSVLALIFSLPLAIWEYNERLKADFSNYIAERIKSAKHMSLEELDNL